MKKKILILGISSFAGSAFANYISKNKNYNIYGTYNSKKLSDSFFLDKKYKNLKFIRCDLSDSSGKLQKIIEKLRPNFILDFASICMVNESWKFPEYYFNVNVNSKIFLINNLEKYKFLEKYIYLGTPEIFGSTKKKINEYCQTYNPSTPYAVSKLTTELMLRSKSKLLNNKLIITRFSNFYGCGQPLYRLIPKVIMSIKQKKKFPLNGDGSSKRDFIFQDDFCKALHLVMRKGKSKNIYHFSTNKFVKIIDIIKIICSEYNYDINKLVKKIPERQGKDQNYFLSDRTTRKMLKWTPKITLNEGIKKTVKYYEKNYKLMKNINNTFKIK